VAADPNNAVQLIIFGWVQTVWFRNWMAGDAKSRGFDGWVRNRWDGTVEGLASGPQAAAK
jgi:acylphosphatase